MSLLASTNALARFATRWFVDDPTTRVMDAALDWQPKWSAGAMLVALISLWLIVTAIHRSRRINLTRPWRIALGLLRAAVIAIPIIILMQPNLAARLERQEPRTLAVLMDRSGSMAIADGDETVPTTRWQRALDTCVPVLSNLAQPTDGPDTDEPFTLAVSLFDQSISSVSLDALREIQVSSTNRQTAIGPALEQLRQQLIGKPLAGVLLVTDGADNASPDDTHPLLAARELARAGVPVHACLVGAERPRELAVTLVADAPFAFANDSVELRACIEQQGFKGEIVEVTLLEGDQVLETRDVRLPDDGRPALERFNITPDEPGRKRYAVQVATLPGELTTENNRAAAEIRVIDEPIRVLYVEHWPRWQYRFLRNAILRDHRFEPRLVLLTEDPATPVEERQTASFPDTPEELETFDVIVIGDVAPQDLASQQWQWLRDHVVDGGAGVIFIAGPKHMPSAFVDEEIGTLLPFERVVSVSEEDVDPFRPELTAYGLHHPLMRWGFGEDPRESWRELPALQWYAGASDLKPGAVVLARRAADLGAGPTPMVVLQRTGRGSVLFVGTDESWKWRYQVGNRYFYGFWSHAIQHVGMPHRVGDYRAVRIEPTSWRIAPETPAAVSVAIEADAGLTDADETLTLTAQPDNGAAPTSFTLRRAADSPFLYEGQFALPAEATYRLFVENYEDQGDAIVEVSSSGGLDPELADPKVNPDLLRQMTDLTGGKLVRLPELATLAAELDLSPLRYRWSEQICLWDGWLMLSILAGLLTVEWILRKWRYLP